MAEGSRGRILIIDDEESVRIALRRTLRRLGFEIEEATSVDEGVEATRRYQPDVVFLDLRMPQAEGTAFLRHLRHLRDAQSGHEPSVIVLSGSAGVEDVIDVLRLGAVDYVRKPWNLTELTSALTSALEAQRVARRSVLAPSPGTDDRGSVESQKRQARLEALADRLRTGALAPPASPPVDLAADPQLAERLVRLAAAGDLASAVAQLGPRHVSNLVDALSLRRFFEVRHEAIRELGAMVWRRSLARASAMRALADVLDPSHTLNGDTAYQVGAMADVGALVLLWAVSDAPDSGLTAEDVADTAHVLDFVREAHQSVGEALLARGSLLGSVAVTASHHHRQTPPATEIAWWNLFILGDELAGHLVAEPDLTSATRRDARSVDRAAAEFGLPRVVLEDVLVQLKDELAAIQGVPD